MAEIEETLQERGNNYGTFAENTVTMQALKEIMRTAPNWKKLTAAQREALEMIQHKVGRILHGNPNHKDSWIDIEGYARLISRELLE